MQNSSSMFLPGQTFAVVTQIAMKFLLFPAFFLVTILLNNQAIAQTSFTGKASYYADKFEGRTTANGEKYRHKHLTAAHKTLPFGTKLRVTNLKNNKTVEVRVNDRGPFVTGRVIDLSKSAAQKIDMINDGVANVKVEMVTDKKPISNWAATGDGTYKVLASSASTSGFGVQVASYQEFYNLLLRLEKLNATGINDTYVNAATVKGKRTFRILVGQYTTRESALKQAKQLEKQLGGKGYFVIEY